jgi:aryl-alcohol dehydrogenase-like predicted oxidoreductase
MTYLTQRNTILDTGIAVSPIGLGTVKIGRDKGVKYPESFTIPDDKQVIELLHLAWDLGINLLDTAPAYGRSEQRLGELLKHVRKDWIIATKAGEYFNHETGESHYDFSPESLIKSVETSLKRLNREVLDIVLIHSDGNDVEIIQQGALEVLHDLKQKGLIRATGMSTKTVEGGIQALQQSDIAMIMHHPHYQAEKPVLDYALAQNKSIFIKKALGSGHLTKDTKTDPVQNSLNFIFAEPAVSSVILGTINPAHLQQNIEKAQSALQLNR